MADAATHEPRALRSTALTEIHRAEARLMDVYAGAQMSTSNPHSLSLSHRSSAQGSAVSVSLHTLGVDSRILPPRAVAVVAVALELNESRATVVTPIAKVIRRELLEGNTALVGRWETRTERWAATRRLSAAPPST